VALIDNKGKLIRELADSKSADFDTYNFGKREYFTIKSDDGKFDLPIIITYPVDFDENKIYPVVMSIYGGPDAGSVRNAWRFGGQGSYGSPAQYWATQGIIQIEADHRARPLRQARSGVDAPQSRTLGNDRLYHGCKMA